jgi:hypothetical protein
MRRPRLLAVASGAGLFLVVVAASATPRPLPFTYNYETLGEGELEVEQYADLTPVKVDNGTSAAGVWVPASQFQTEFEYGITNRLELGLYMTLAPTPNPSVFPQSTPPLTEGNGVKERLRLRLFDEGVLPVDIGLYGELTENEREFEIEAKIILQKRFGNLRIAANLVGEHEWYYASKQQDWVIDPSAGATYQVTPVFQPGIDSWMWSEFTNVPYLNAMGLPGGPTPFNNKPNVYVGPAILLNFGKFWWSTGAYIRVTNFDHVMSPGVDSFGPVWFRMIIGISF